MAGRDEQTETESDGLMRDWLSVLSAGFTVRCGLFGPNTDPPTGLCMKFSNAPTAAFTLSAMVFKEID